MTVLLGVMLFGAVLLLVVGNRPKDPARDPRAMHEEHNRKLRRLAAQVQKENGRR